jgi:adenylate kinase family enzyme
VRRICVVGNSGSGKTTLAAGLAASLGVPHLELDSIFHQPGWEPLPHEEFRAAVTAFTAADGWVVDGNYKAVRDIVWRRADTIVWLDLPRPQVMRQVIGRTLRRVARRTELWNGNREPWSNLCRADPEKSIIMWAWTHDRIYRERYAQAQVDPAHAHLQFVRLCSRSDMTAFLGQARAAPSPAPPATGPAPSGPAPG